MQVILPEWKVQNCTYLRTAHSHAHNTNSSTVTNSARVLAYDGVVTQNKNNSNIIYLNVVV